jgi:hypothetical protein
MHASEQFDGNVAGERLRTRTLLFVPFMAMNVDIVD